MIIFDGRVSAAKIEEGLRGKRANMATIVNPDNSGGMLYTKLKKAAAERLNFGFEVYELKTKEDAETVIRKLNADQKTNGIMIQLPFLDKECDEFLIDLIDLKKDIDGLRKDSPFKPAVVRAVLEILPVRAGAVVVGAKGLVGSRLVKELRAVGMDRNNFSAEVLKKADVIISCTGQAGLIRANMVKKGVVAVDVGYPKGDFDPEVALKASFFTPVPGGVGPVTVACLMANLVESV